MKGEQKKQNTQTSLNGLQRILLTQFDYKQEEFMQDFSICGHVY